MTSILIEDHSPALTAAIKVGLTPVPGLWRFSDGLRVREFTVPRDEDAIAFVDLCRPLDSFVSCDFEVNAAARRVADVVPPVCRGCHWSLDIRDPEDLDQCPRGASPIFAQTQGRCAKYNVDFPDQAPITRQSCCGATVPDHAVYCIDAPGN